MILRNAIQTPDGTVLESFHRHDYIVHTDAITGKLYGVDGGRDYFRYIGDIEDCKILSLTSDASHTAIRKTFTWGTCGKNADQPLKRVPLEHLSNAHIEAILETQTQLLPQIKNIFDAELLYRSDRNIYIPD